MPGVVANPSSSEARTNITVGYESASQFSREYARMVGLPPMRDVARFRTPAPGAPASSA